MKQSKIIAIAAIFVSAVLIFILGRDLIPLLRQVIASSGNETEMKQYIEAYGARGVPLLIGLQFLQVMIPLLPSSPVQILGGLCYGIFLGALLSLIGFIAGHSLLFIAMRKLGGSFAGTPDKPRESRAIKWIMEKSAFRTEELIFLLYLLPMFPNGILPFIFARTKISYGKYLACMFAAMVPATIICTTVGDRLAEGDLITALIIVGVSIALMILLYVFRDRILALFNKDKGQRSFE